MERTAVDQGARVRAQFRREREERDRYFAGIRRVGAGEILARALLVVVIAALLVYVAVPKARGFVRHVSEVIDGSSRP